MTNCDQSNNIQQGLQHDIQIRIPDLPTSTMHSQNQPKSHPFVYQLNPHQHKFYHAVGLLKAEWYANQQLVSQCYGTAFLVSNRLVLTCAHTIYHEKMKRKCDKIYFIPNFDGHITKDMKIYQSVPNNFLAFEVGNKTFGDRPLENDISMIYLSENVENIRPLKISENQFIPDNTELLVSGYPSQLFNKKRCFPDVFAERKTQSGTKVQLDHSEPFILHYNMKTKVGHSGSPILMKVGDQYVVVAIHTHKLKIQINSGLLINKNQSVKIERFEKQLLFMNNTLKIDKINILKPEELPDFRNQLDQAIDEISHQDSQDSEDSEYSASDISFKQLLGRNNFEESFEHSSFDDSFFALNAKYLSDFSGAIDSDEEESTYSTRKSFIYSQQQQGAQNMLVPEQLNIKNDSSTTVAEQNKHQFETTSKKDNKYNVLERCELAKRQCMLNIMQLSCKGLENYRLCQQSNIKQISLHVSKITQETHHNHHNHPIKLCYPIKYSYPIKQSHLIKHEQECANTSISENTEGEGAQTQKQKSCFQFMRQFESMVILDGGTSQLFGMIVMVQIILNLTQKYDTYKEYLLSQQLPNYLRFSPMIRS